MRKSHSPTAVMLVLGLASLFITGCATSEGMFLDQSVPDAVKSRVVTDAGIAAYNSLLVAKGDLSNVDAVKQYFVVALKYDPGNTTAQRYLGLTTGFRDALLQTILREAKALAAKKSGRTEDETLKLCILIQRAWAIDPKNTDLLKLDKDVTADRNLLVALYLSRAKVATDKKAKASTAAAKEPLVLSAFQSLAKAVQADPHNSQATGLINSVRPEVSAIIAAKMKSVQPLMAKGSYTAARTQIDTVASLSSKLGGAYDAETRKAYFKLYYTWAKFFFDRKDYAQADIKINAALSYQSDPSALALKQKNAALKDQAEQGVTFEDGIANVDSLVKRGSLAQAMRILSSLAAKTNEKAKLDQIEAQRSRIRSSLAILYDKGIAAYQAESFAEAIDALEDVVAIDPGYQQAADYLDKARAKQQVLDSN